MAARRSKAAPAASAPPWLQDLENKVHEVAERLREIRTENERMRDQLRELEAELGESAGTDAAAWRQEREEIRERVEKLAQHLEGLLEEDG